MGDYIEAVLSNLERVKRGYYPNAPTDNKIKISKYRNKVKNLKLNRDPEYHCRVKFGLKIQANLRRTGWVLDSIERRMLQSVA